MFYVVVRISMGSLLQNVFCHPLGFCFFPPFRIRPNNGRILFHQIHIWWIFNRKVVCPQFKQIWENTGFLCHWKTCKLTIQVNIKKTSEVPSFGPLHLYIKLFYININKLVIEMYGSEVFSTPLYYIVCLDPNPSTMGLKPY